MKTEIIGSTYEHLRWAAQEKVLQFPSSPFEVPNPQYVDITIDGPIEEEKHLIDIKA